MLILKINDNILKKKKIKKVIKLNKQNTSKFYGTRTFQPKINIKKKKIVKQTNIDQNNISYLKNKDEFSLLADELFEIFVQFVIFFHFFFFLKGKLQPQKKRLKRNRPTTR